LLATLRDGGSASSDALAAGGAIEGVVLGRLAGARDRSARVGTGT
jgi:hypothetical protein